MGTQTDFDQLPDAGGDVGKRKFMRFDPTVSMGTLIQLGSLLGVVAALWGTYQSDKATMRQELDQVKATAKEDKADARAALLDIKTDMKAMATTLTQVNLTLAVIDAKQPSKGKP